MQSNANYPRPSSSGFPSLEPHLIPFHLIPCHHNPPIHPATLLFWGTPTCRRGYATHHLSSPSTRTVPFAIRANVVALSVARSPALTCSPSFVSVSRPCRYKGYTRPVRNGTLSRAPVLDLCPIGRHHTRERKGRVDLFELFLFMRFTALF